MSIEQTILHFDKCGCAIWAESDGVHVSPCDQPGHEERMMDVARGNVPEHEIIRDRGWIMEATTAPTQRCPVCDSLACDCKGKHY